MYEFAVVGAGDVGLSAAVRLTDFGKDKSVDHDDFDFTCASVGRAGPSCAMMKPAGCSRKQY